jgi:nucleoside-diphosphate-sugar epimerase
MFKSNVLATLLLLDWAKHIGVESFTYLSSGEIYGRGNSIDEKGSSNPHGFYATTKQQAEMLLKFYGRFFGIQTLRVFFPFDKGLEQGFVWNLVQTVMSGQAVEAEYSYISPTFGADIVEPLIKMREQKGATIGNICGSPVKLEQLVDELKQVVQKSPKKVVPGKTTLTGKNTYAKEQLGYRETALHEAIRHSFSALE